MADFFSQQEAELRRGEASGSFDDPYRYFGARIPGGGYWYNWSPQAYIECGIAGAFGTRSFDEEDGERADASGDAKLTGAEEVSRRLDALAGTDQPSALPELTWEQIQHFGVCGQSYE